MWKSDGKYKTQVEIINRWVKNCCREEEALHVSIPNASKFICIGCQGQMRTACGKLKSLQEKCESTLSKLNRRLDRRISHKGMTKDDQKMNSSKSLFLKTGIPLVKENPNPYLGIQREFTGQAEKQT